MKRWHADRIGGMFSQNGERVATAMLERTHYQSVDLGVEYGAYVTAGRPARHTRIHLHGQAIDGYSKDLETAKPEPLMFISVLATLLGARSAPYIYLPDTREVFSPVCVESPASLQHHGFTGLHPASVGAAGQFKYFINDGDGEHNTVRCRQTNEFYLIDHEMAEPEHRTATACDRFIELSLDAQPTSAAKHAYKSGAAAMVQRIRSMTEENLQGITAYLQDQGMMTDPDFVGGLMERRDHMQQPVYPVSVFDWCAPKFG